MAFSRPQFRLSTLLWITLAVACWFGGVHWNRRQLQIELENSNAARAILEFGLKSSNDRWSKFLKEFDLAIQHGMIRPNDEAKQLRAEIEEARQQIAD